VNPDKHGTKLAAHYRVKIDAGQTKVIRLRLSKNSPDRKRESLGNNLMKCSLTGFVKPMSFISLSRRYR
jgi:hypothetical protein